MESPTLFSLDFYTEEGVFPPQSVQEIRRLGQLRRKCALSGRDLMHGDTLRLEPVDLVPFLTYPVGSNVTPGELDYRRAVLQAHQSDMGKKAGVLPIIRIERSLQTGEKWSQVWIAEVQGASGMPKRVVVKLYDDASYPDPDWFNCPQEGSRIWLPSPYAAANEAWLYAHLKEVQGRLIPQSFGFYRTTLPTGKEVALHLVELLQSVTVGQFAESSASTDEKIAMADRVCAALAHLHSLDIIHGDVSPRHLLITEPDRLVWIDFGLSELVHGRSNPKIVLDDSERIEIVRDLLGLEMQLIHHLCRRFDGCPWMQDLDVDEIFRWRMKVLQNAPGKPNVRALQEQEAERRRFCPPCRL